MQSSKRSDVAPFLAMDVVARANMLASEGKDIISMAVGQPSAKPPAAAIEAATQAINKRAMGYTDACGTADLKSAMHAYYKAQYGLDIDPERFVITTGSSAGFMLAFLGLFDVGQRIAIPSPGYPAYRNILKSLGLEVVEIATDDDSNWTLNADILRQANAEEKLDGLLFANPNNPNGTMLDGQAFGALVTTCRELDIKLVSDEIYHRLTYNFEGECALAFDDDAIVINSFSKFFCMTGWRIGWMIVPERLQRVFNNLQQNLFICAPDVSQVAARAALFEDTDLLKVKEGYRKNRSLFLEQLPQLGIHNIQPIDGAFYAYGDVSELCKSSMHFAKDMLEHAGVAATPGLDFDTERGHRWVRFSFAGDHARMAEGFERIKNWMKI